MRWVTFVPFSRLCTHDNKDSFLLTAVSPQLEQSLAQIGPPSIFIEYLLVPREEIGEFKGLKRIFTNLKFLVVSFGEVIGLVLNHDKRLLIKLKIFKLH